MVRGLDLIERWQADIFSLKKWCSFALRAKIYYYECVYGVKIASC